ncbi:GRP family sugar transporter [Lactiplantibacillus paraplantarum]|uniref:GRP family sugar transporter n=1 Tax=Lactiplantibacillus paraplantarum TaxID=60520 RepID=UPI00051366F3|nr:GRP family sugar transporter [Lactiplantibacillus paraplantarum]OAX74797.1 sugar transporter [Lactiplantibacillus plantarum]ALO04841.1 sugar transporter [Lactiplantibacillus paraplantarum]KGE74250.1 sugar transporter [Lactiplantibacillus paraplantarum]MCT4457356.1 sugar transporter [Lactiplantibacillus paraplantarum]MCW1910944.1 GRP family sugar transporter [Lactiplantibacillus paraplantarum]
MAILIALIPALCWGINPLLVRKINGRSENEMFGMGMGVGLVALIFWGLFHPTVSAPGWAIGLAVISGAAWAVGQLGQYVSYQLLGVSRTMPVSTALQLIGTSLIGVLMFGEWAGWLQKVTGLLAIVLIVTGSLLSVGSSDGHRRSLNRYLPLIVTTTGYWVYSCIPKLIRINAVQLFLPQMIGIMVVAVGWALYQQPRVYREKLSWFNLLPGVLYGIAAFMYILAARSVGVTNAYIIGQLSVVIATLSGVLFLHENEGQHRMVKVMTGLLFIFIGCATTALI